MPSVVKSRRTITREASRRRKARNYQEWRQQLRQDLVRFASLCYNSNKEWAHAAGVCESTVSRFVNGEGKWHRDETLYYIASAVGAEILLTVE